MAFLPGFEFDIFISYASVDDQPALGEEKGWVTLFHEALEVQLSKRVGRMGVIKIWRGPLIEGEQVFDQTIKTAIDNSALFLALTSQGFLTSTYCQQELMWFREKAGREIHGLQIGDRLRIYNALLNNIPYQTWQKELSRVSGYPFDKEFHRISSHKFHDAKRDDEFGEPTNPRSVEFQQQHRKLVDSLYKMLLEFKEKFPIASAATEPLPAADETPAVYFAEVTDSLRPTRTFVINELKRQGIKIERAIPPPFPAVEHEREVIATLSKALLSVHLLDQFAGREIDDAPGEYYPQKQVTLGKLHAKSQFIWVPKQLDVQTVEEATHKNFLHQLESGMRSEARYDFVRGSKATLAQEILDKLKQLQASPQTGVGAAVLLDTHLKDQLYAFELGRFLIENGIQPFINPQEDDPRQNIEVLEARLKQASSLIVLFGHVHENWVRERLGVALQLSVVKNYPVKTFAIFLLPPEKKSANIQFNFGAINVQVIDSSKSAKLDPGALEPILRLAKTGGAR